MLGLLVLGLLRRPLVLRPTREPPRGRGLRVGPSGTARLLNGRGAGRPGRPGLAGLAAGAGQSRVTGGRRIRRPGERLRGLRLRAAPAWCGPVACRGPAAPGPAWASGPGAWYAGSAG